MVRTTAIWLTLLVLSHPAIATEAATGTGRIQCQIPGKAGTVPDGATASIEEMRQAKEMVQTFVSEGQTFLDCISKKIDRLEKVIERNTTADGNGPQQVLDQKQTYGKLVQVHDAVVSHMQSLAEAFNTAVRDFKARDE